ncbi:hypothetical protein [Marinobacterium mangrovicola]|uniref:DUF2764 family protein n=1 Tax=Marinobacterium mangrovicola TaxID=1476959 RepID=A0A4R1GDM4_9GAMM|nr:hypothetical protein [Marinobacterium mangrovicola]TCK04921.1 hypothetical protein CLV83_3371 [Marinobacterium mangrovicola]
MTSYSHSSYSRSSYYTLIPSLPALAPLNKLQELPCSTLKLEQRLTMLNDRDREQLDRALRLCQRERIGDEEYSDTDEVSHWQEELAAIDDPLVTELIADYLESRTLVAALRYRLAGQSSGADFKGFGSRVWLIQRNWQQPLFGLEHQFPWLVRAREALEANEGRVLENLLLERFWTRLWRTEQTQHFSFAAIVAYRLRWALSEYRLRWDQTAAVDYFDRWAEAALDQFSFEPDPISTGSEA